MINQGLRMMMMGKLGVTAPSAPILSLYVLGVTNLQMQWTEPSGATSYKIDVSTEANFASFVGVYNDYTVNLLYITLTSLSAHVTYYIRVRAVNSGGSSSNSNTITATTWRSTPVITNVTGAGETGYIYWNSQPDATNYNVAVTVDGDDFGGNWPGPVGDVVTYGAGGTAGQFFQFKLYCYRYGVWETDNYAYASVTLTI